MTTFEGIWVPLVTPFRQGKLDLYGAQQLAVTLSSAGVHGLVVCGTTGEAATLNEHEQDKLLCGVMEAVQGRCPVAMGIGGSDTRAVAEKIAHINTLQPTAFLVSSPAYVRPSQEGLRLHFEAVAAAAENPVILYNIPSRTGVNIEPGTVIALERQRNIVAIKECGGNLAQTMELLHHSGLKILCGDDAMLFNTLCLGAHGAISAAAHIRPDLFVRLFELVRAGQIERARTLFKQLLPVIQLLFSEPNPGPVKAALSIQSHIQDELRLPMTPMSAAGRVKLARALDELMALPFAMKIEKPEFSINGKSRQLGLVR
ncbi:MAG: 4-hydroxy-tetrahydrodipicolinate synthase [Collimonas sp.]|uniref:4-hydroxy-tetrahydrodipicolinate synthase n=1 Tax=Collimonas sp. TaxID=1963772 RepID=UPI0032649C51